MLLVSFFRHVAFRFDIACVYGKVLVWEREILISNNTNSLFLVCCFYGIDNKCFVL